MLPAIAIGAGLAAGGLAGSIFGKKKKASVDTGAMLGAINKSTETQKNLVGNQFSDLQQPTAQFKTGMGQLGEDYLKSTQANAENYQKNLTQVGEAEKVAADKALAASQTAQASTIPLQQQAIRQSLASAGQLRTGAAAKALTAPVQQLTQNLGQERAASDVNIASRNAARLEQGVNTLYQSKAGADLEKLGMDKDTLTTLLNAGRTDIINKYASLIGIDQQQLANILGVQGIQANVGLANTAASNQNQAAIYNALTGLGGQIMGAGIAS
jgi:hypothetical protein